MLLASNAKAFYDLFEQIPFLEKLGLDGGSPCFFEKETDNCNVS